MDERALLRLMLWLSPAFPTGGFAYSQGLEWAVAAGDVADGASLARWLEDTLAHGQGLADAMLLRAAHRAHDEPARLAELAELAAAAALPRERAEETLAQGGAFLRAARCWPPCPPAGLPLAYPLAVGALAGLHAIAEEAAAAAFLAAQAAALVSAAVRLVPLGQSAGLAVLAGLEPALLALAARSAHIPLADLGGSAWRAEIAAMRHETQATRLFRS